MRFHRADIAYLTDHPDLEALLAPLVERSPTNRLWGGESVRLRYAYALQKRGESARSKVLAAEAERYARERIAAGDDTPDQRVELAAVAALRGDADAALEWLERAFEAGYRDYGFLERDPIFRPLGSDARFVRVLDRMRRDVEAQRERARTRGLLELKSLIGRASVVNRPRPFAAGRLFEDQVPIAAPAGLTGTTWEQSRPNGRKDGAAGPTRKQDESTK